MKISSFNFLLILTLACKSPPKPRWIPPAWSPSNIVKAATTYVEKQTERIGDVAKSTVETATRVATDPVGFAEDTANAVKNQAVGLVNTVKSAAECTSKGDLNCLKEAGESYANDMVEMAKDPGGVINDMVNNPEDLAAGALIGGAMGGIGKKFTSSKSKSTCPCCRRKRSYEYLGNLYNQVLNDYRLQHRVRRMPQQPPQQGSKRDKQRSDNPTGFMQKGHKHHKDAGVEANKNKKEMQKQHCGRKNRK